MMHHEKDQRVLAWLDKNITHFADYRTQAERAADESAANRAEMLARGELVKAETRQ